MYEKADKTTFFKMYTILIKLIKTLKQESIGLQSFTL